MPIWQLWISRPDVDSDTIRSVDDSSLKIGKAKQIAAELRVSNLFETRFLFWTLLFQPVVKRNVEDSDNRESNEERSECLEGVLIAEAFFIDSAFRFDVVPVLCGFQWLVCGRHDYLELFDLVHECVVVDMVGMTSNLYADFWTAPIRASRTQSQPAQVVPSRPMHR